MPEEFQKPIYSQSMKAGGKTYFFDVKQARGEKGGKYLLVSESRLDKGVPVRNHITVFSRPSRWILPGVGNGERKSLAGACELPN